MEHLQYGRRQYGLLQYGRYPAKDSGKSTYAFKKARIKAHIKGKDTEWIIQNEPVFISGDHSFFRLKTNENSYIYSKRVTVPGYFSLIRISTPNQVVISQLNRNEGSVT